MVVANVEPLPRFNLGYNVSKEHSDDSQFRIVAECLNNCQQLVSSDSIERTTHVDTQYAKRFLKTLSFRGEPTITK